MSITYLRGGSKSISLISRGGGGAACGEIIYSLIVRECVTSIRSEETSISPIGISLCNLVRSNFGMIVFAENSILFMPLADLIGEE